MFVPGPSRSVSQVSSDLQHQVLEDSNLPEQPSSNHLSNSTFGQDEDSPLIRAAKLAANQIADLIDNVSQGILSNQDSPNPAVANKRLLDTAVSLTLDVLRTTKVNGRTVFQAQAQGSRDAISNYSRVSNTTLLVPAPIRRLTMAVREVAHAFTTLSAGTSSEAQRSIGYLQELGARLRGSVDVQAIDESQVLDVMA